MKALILQHEYSTPAGTSLTWLEQKKIPWTTVTSVTMVNDPELPEMHSFDLLIICGGKMNVDEEEKYPLLK